MELVHGDQTATVVEVGGALRAYAAGGRPLLDGYGIDERCTGARGQTLIPWPNRLRDGSYRFGAEDHQLPLSEPAKHNAIHGLVRWANWSVAERSEDVVTMTHTLHPRAGWPFLLDLRIEYRLGPEGLAVGTTATNAGIAPCPYGAGAHPYLTLGSPTIDEYRLRAPGDRWIPTDDQGIPDGSRAVDGTEYDFRAPRLIGSTALDTGYEALARDGAGVAHVELTGRDGATARIWMDDGYPYLMLFTGDSLKDPDHRRRGLGVEPMTCAPNALQSGQGLRTLKPGESFTSRWGISPHPRTP
ncbi:MAG: aldose 1-epimerase family protein [Actinomycetota bacterium]|nr:aldose 1-epimerase family protein [Actinomycetota bacterium]